MCLVSRQALLIALLAKVGVIPENGTWVFYKDIKQVSTGLQVLGFI